MKRRKTFKFIDQIYFNRSNNETSAAVINVLHNNLNFFRLHDIDREYIYILATSSLIKDCPGRVALNALGIKKFH